MIRRIRLPLAAVGAVAVALVGAGSAAAKPAADCQPYGATPCLLPFPNNLLTKVDHTTPTGLRVHLPAAAMPVNQAGSRVKVGDYDRADGFSPGSALIVHVGGLDLVKTGAVSLADMSKTFARKAPIVVIDEKTGARQLIWAEMDANAQGDANVNLLIHPGKNFLEGHTYAVALRNLRNTGGRLIQAPKWFALLRDGRRLPKIERSQLKRYNRIFTTLKRVNIARASLYEAWDFTVASQRSLAGRMLAIRNNAFAQLGDSQPRQRHRPGSRAVVRRDRPGAAGGRHGRPAGHRDVQRPVLPGGVWPVRDDHVPLRLTQARCPADADSRQRGDGAV